jgi:hypothetical protein
MEEPAAGHLSRAGTCRSRRADRLRSERARQFPARSGLCRSHSLRGKARRFARRAADQARAGHQSQDREGPRPRRALVSATARGRGDRVRFGPSLYRRSPALLTPWMASPHPERFTGAIFQLAWPRNFITLLGGVAACGARATAGQAAGHRISQFHVGGRVGATHRAFTRSPTAAEQR